MKTARPWIVRYADFRRYLYRAVHYCHQRDRVVFFAYKKQWLALVPFENWERKLRAAKLAFARCEVTRISLAALPPLRANSRRHQH